LANQERDPRAYELMTVFIPDLTDEDSQAEIEKIEGLVTANGGTMTDTLTASPWGRRRLAYTIRFNGVDYRDGIYTVFHFDMTPSSLTEIEREMKLDTNLMRYLLVHDDPKAREKFPEGSETEDGESESASTSADAGAAAGATAAAASQVASTSDTESAASDAPVSESTEPAPAETAPAEETTTDTASVAEAAEPAESVAPASETTEPAAAESAPVEEAPAKDTTTDTAPPAADEAASDDDKE
jgi:small subunit ribosomal protein S6